MAMSRVAPSGDNAINSRASTRRGAIVIGEGFWAGLVLGGVAMLSAAANR
jgi:hypothetical protein